MHTHTHTHTYIHTHTNTHANIHTYIHTYINRWLNELLEKGYEHFSEPIFSSDGRLALTEDGMRIIFSNHYLYCQELLVFSCVLMVGMSFTKYVCMYV